MPNFHIAAASATETKNRRRKGSRSLQRKKKHAVRREQALRIKAPLKRRVEAPDGVSNAEVQDDAGRWSETESRRGPGAPFANKRIRLQRQVPEYDQRTWSVGRRSGARAAARHRGRTAHALITAVRSRAAADVGERPHTRARPARPPRPPKKCQAARGQSPLARCARVSDFIVDVQRARYFH